MAARARCRFVGGVALVVALVTVGAGCARREFEDRTAVVRLGGSTQTYQVDSCGLDGQTVFVVARAPDGAVVQGVMGLRNDDRTGIEASTGMTVDLDPSSPEARVAAFGAEAWSRRGSIGSPPGAITSARLRGSRIQFAGDAVAVDASDQPRAGAEPQSFSIDARCDEVER